MFILNTVASVLQIPKISWKDLRYLTERNLPPGMALVRDIERNGRTIAFAPNSSAASEKPMPLSYTAQVTRRPHWYSTGPAGAFLYITLEDKFTGERSRFEYDSNNDYANFTYMPSEPPRDDKALTPTTEDEPTLGFTSHRYPKGIPDTTSINADDPFYRKGRKFIERASAHHWGCLLALDELKNRSSVID